MIKFESMLNELNETDYSVGHYPIEDTKELAEQLTEYGINAIEVTSDYILFSDGGQQYKMYNDVDWKIEEGENTNLKVGSTIEITGYYDEIAWYSKLLGKKFEVLEINSSEVKVKRGNGRYSYYVGKGDYKVLS